MEGVAAAVHLSTNFLLFPRIFPPRKRRENRGRDPISSPKLVLLLLLLLGSRGRIGPLSQPLDFSQFERGGGGPVFPPPQSIRKTFFSGGGSPFTLLSQIYRGSGDFSWVEKKASGICQVLPSLSCSAFRCTGNKSVFRSKFFSRENGVWKRLKNRVAVKEERKKRNFSHFPPRSSPSSSFHPSAVLPFFRSHFCTLRRAHLLPAVFLGGGGTCLVGYAVWLQCVSEDGGGRNRWMHYFVSLISFIVSSSYKDCTSKSEI